jgi:plastocyanin
VHPSNEQPAKEFYVVFGEIYGNNIQGLFTAANGTGTLDLNKFLARNPDLVLTNGMAHKYVPSIGAFSKIDLNPDAQVFQVQPGELTRWYIVNGGPSDDVAFHFISGIISVHDGSIQNRYGTQVLNDETWLIPPGSASVIEAVFPSEGIYVGVDHAMDDVLKGGAFAVLATPDSTPDDHPQGTMVPPRGSDMVTGPPMTTNATGVTTGVNATELGPETAEGEGLPVTNVTGTENATETEGGATTGGTENTTETGAAMSNATETEGGAAAGGTENATETEGGATTGANGGGGTATGVSITTGSSTKTTDAFQPNPAQVSVGSTVTWTNEDAQPHTVNSGENATPDGTFDSGILAPAATYDFTFTEAGEYPYFCLLHPNMVGTVSVS